MKIALLSPYISHNYGTVLQAFALQRCISKMGVDSEYIHVHLYKGRLGMIKYFIHNPLFLYRLMCNRYKNRNLLKYNFLSGEKYSKIIKKNKEFVERFLTFVSKPYVPSEYIVVNKKYDLFVAGSDQTWSPELDYKYSPFFLPFVKDVNKKGSYACSFGTNNIDSKYKIFLKKALSDFRYLSCRDKQNAKMLEQLLGVKVANVLDPTLLMNKESWAAYMEKIEMPKKYILCYILGTKQCISQYAEKVGKELNLPVYYILTRPEYESKKNVIENIGCQEFLYLIANCSYLVTDSFHGTIFAINFHKDVESFNKYESNSFDNGRIFDILSEFGLGNHFHEDGNFDMPSHINYEMVIPIVEEKRNISLEYLSYMISK